MGVEYKFNAGYGFLLPLDKFALPAMWDDREMWNDGTVEKDISGSGMTPIFGGDNWGGRYVWGFVATETYTRMDRLSDSILAPVRDVDPTVLGNIFDIRSRVKRPKARIGWTMWADIL